jgi:hypothetical protein
MSDDDPTGGSPPWPRTLRYLPLYFRNRDGEVDYFDPEETMGHWRAPDTDEVVWKIARGRYVLFHVVYSEPEKAGEIMEPLFGQELTRSET